MLSNRLFEILHLTNDFLWEYLAIFLILILGIWLTINSRFFQFKAIIYFVDNIKELLNPNNRGSSGLSPIRLIFTSVGGMIGVGNLVVVGTGLVYAGPGILLWLWVACFIGIVVKYSEIYLGIKYRQENSNSSYSGGPMHYLSHALGVPIAVLFSILLCIYGAEIFQFKIIVEIINKDFNINQEFAIVVTYLVVMLTVLGDFKRLSKVCSILMPILIIAYILAASYIILDNYQKIPEIFTLVLSSAFSPKVMLVGGGVGTLFTTIHIGLQRAIYSGDIGIGFDSMIHSQTSIKDPAMQARLACITLITDTLICSITLLLLLVTNSWLLKLPAHQLITTTFANHITFGWSIINILLLIAAYTTLTGYLVVGANSAKFINKKYGHYLYYIYASICFILFSYQDLNNILLIMELSGAIMISINIIGIFKLRKEIQYN